MRNLQRLFTAFLLLAAALLFTAVGIVGPGWVTEHVILKFVTLPAEVPGPPVSGAAAPRGVVDSLITDGGIAAHIKALSSLPSRVVGYPGNRAAMTYVRDAFETIGLKRVTVEPFRVSSPVDHGFTLTLQDGTVIPIHQLWPNFIRLNAFPEGVSGPLLYSRKGEFGAFNGHPTEGGIVLMDFDGRAEFLNARMLGAAAIIFFNNAPDAVSQNQAARKILDVPANVPRFWVDDGAAARLLELAKTGKTRVTLQGCMSWERAATGNVLGWLPGSEERMPGSTGDNPQRWKDHILVLSAFYDAMSVVPGVAPGAENAGGIAALLEIARALTVLHPKYTVLFLATSAHFYGLQGVNAFLDRHNRGEAFFLDRIPAKDRIPFDLFMGIDLTSQLDQTGLFCYGSFENFGPELKNLYAPLAKRFIEYARTAELDGRGVESEAPYVNTLLPSKRTQYSFMPARQAFDAELVSLAGLHGLTFSTINDDRVRVDTPLDRPEYVRVPNLTAQARTITLLLSDMLSDPDAFRVDDRIRIKDEGRDLEGRVVEFDRTVDFFTPRAPVPGALVTYEAGFQSHAGVRGFMVTQADSAGLFRMSMIRDPKKPVKLRSYGLDDLGNIVYAPDLGEEGDKMFPLDVPNVADVNKTIQVLFPCRALDLFDIVDPGAFSALDNLKVLGRDNGPLRKYGAAFIEKQRLFGNWTTNAAVVFARPSDRPKMFMTSGPVGLKYLITNTPEEWLDAPADPPGDRLEAARGAGYPMDRGFVLYPFYQSARDLWALNGARLANLQKHGVTNARAEALHARSTRALLAARSALHALQYDTFAARAREAWGYEARAYPDVRYAADDTVDGIVFYFMLLLPFCFFIERLFFGFPDIRKQMATGGGIFVLVFLLLQSVHPAFQLSLTPYIVFLAFIILALGVIIIILLVTKFDSEMKGMTRAAAGLHEADIGRLSATAVAISLGISNLRKRKLRTALTAVTLTLLTFTVLSFTSFKTGIHFYTLDRGNRPPYQGALLRSLSWRSLPNSFLPYVRNAFAEQAHVIPRSWYQPEDMESPYIDVKVPQKGTAGTVQVLLGLHADEPLATGLDRMLLPGGRWFLPEERMVCLLPTECAERLHVTAGDVGKAKVSLLGTSYTVVGLLDSGKLDAYRDMDNEGITPTSFVMMQQLSQTSDEEYFRSTMKSAEHIRSANVLILPYQQTLDLSGSTRSVAVAGFTDEAALRKSVEAFMSRVVLAMFVGSGDAVKVYSSLGTTSISGLSHLIIPILIAAFLVLNTMMGAVFERFREIGVYSAVGLAPNHVAALFMAEAAVFAVLGAVLGYLMGQLLVIALTSLGLLGSLSLNYSSLSAVYSTLVVMLVVFLSTLYPAKKAADMTVEDVSRRWEPPRPDGDDWAFEFPFTVTAVEALPLSVYLAHIFRTHEDSSAENFVSENTRLSHANGAEAAAYRVMTTTWLAPYDLAISQDVTLDAEPMTEEEGRLYRIYVRIHRRSGDRAQWQTINRRFFSVLRKRFLVWRTLPYAVKEEYREIGMATEEEVIRV